MRHVTVFNQVSLDGYFCDSRGDMSWAHKQDPEWSAFVSQNASGDAVLMFGRITYTMMASYWPTSAALQANPLVAERMNSASKVVFSNTLAKATWSNTMIVKGDIAAEVTKMKHQPGPDMVIMGSGTIVSQLTAAGVVDSYQIVVNPIVLGSGRTMFDAVTPHVTLNLEKTQAFSNGNVVLWYRRNYDRR